MSRKTQVVLAIAICVLVIPTAAFGQSRFRTEGSGLSAQVGAGFALILPFAHAELRYHPNEPFSLSAYASGAFVTLAGTIGSYSFETGFILANLGVEGRGHLYAGERWDFHAGLGASALTLVSGDDTNYLPVVYLNAGVTFAPTARLRLDADINPMMPIDQASEMKIAPLPVLRARLVL